VRSFVRKRNLTTEKRGKKKKVTVEKSLVGNRKQEKDQGEEKKMKDGEKKRREL